MAHLFDIIFAVLIVIVVGVAAKRGIVLTVLDIAAGIISFLFAKLLAPKAANMIYNGHVREIVLTFLSERYADVQNSVGEALSNVVSAFDFLPEGVLKYANSTGIINTDELLSSFSSKVTTVAQLEENVVAPVVITLLTILCFAVIAALLLIVLKIIARFLAKIITTTRIAKKFDVGLGAAFGLVKGCIYAFIAAAVVSVVSCSVPSLAQYAADSYFCTAASVLIGL